MPFLKTLRGLLDENLARVDGGGGGGGSREEGQGVKSESEIDIVSRNLLGFDDGDHEPPFGMTPRPRGDSDSQGTNGNGVSVSENENLPFSLEDQICAVWDTILELVTETNYDEVILMGHSVGAYIGMEIFHRHRHHQIRKDQTDRQGLKQDLFNLQAGIMLFPTVWDIAQSPNGRKFDMLIRNVPFMDRNAHFLARRMVDWMPTWVLKTLLRMPGLMGFSDLAAEVTVKFLKSRDGIWQSIYLAKDEMAIITAEKWDREMWEVPVTPTSTTTSTTTTTSSSTTGEQKSKVPEPVVSPLDAKGQVGGKQERDKRDKFFFLFGKQDHWVADRTRDAFIEKRKEHGELGRVKILVEETGKVPHAFCIRESFHIPSVVDVFFYLGYLSPTLGFLY